MSRTPEQPDDDTLRALYRRERPEPSGALDDAILAAARHEADRPVRRGRHYRAGLGAVASALLAVLLFQQSSHVREQMNVLGDRDPRHEMAPVVREPRADAPADTVGEPNVAGRGAVEEVIVTGSYVEQDDARDAASPTAGVAVDAPRERARAAAPPAAVTADSPCGPGRLVQRLTDMLPAQSGADAVVVCATDTEIALHVTWRDDAQCPSPFRLPRTGGAPAVEVLAPDGVLSIEIREDDARRTLRCKGGAWHVE